MKDYYTLERAKKFEESATIIESNPTIYANILDKVAEFRAHAAHIREHLAQKLTIFHHPV